MKILLLYTPRCGTNSLCKYFLKQNTDYVYFNQPWSKYQEGEIQPVSYDECIKYKNVLVKSQIQNLHKLGIPKEKLHYDFDKIMMMSRLNKREQAISFITASHLSNFLESTPRKYFIKDIDEEYINDIIYEFSDSDLLFDNYKKDDSILLHYETLFYEKNFKDVFNFLNLKFIESDFDSILDLKNKYFKGEYELKKNKSLI